MPTAGVQYDYDPRMYPGLVRSGQLPGASYGTSMDPNIYNTGYTPGAGGMSGGMLPTGGLRPNAPYDYSPAYGGKPTMPNPIDTARTSVEGNLGNLPGIKDLAGQTNLFNLDELYKQYVKANPELMAQLGKSASNISSYLAGEVPEDVKRVLAQNAAQRGVSLGTPGSPFSNYDYLRSLGQTSLGLQQYGETALTNSMNRTPKVDQLNPATMFVTPEQQQAAQYWANLYAAGPVPGVAQNNALAAALMGMGGLGNRNPNYGGGSFFFPRYTDSGGGSSGGGYVSPPSAPSTNTGPGWGEAWNNQGGYASAGNVPGSTPVGTNATTYDYTMPSLYGPNATGYVTPDFELDVLNPSNYWSSSSMPELGNITDTAPGYGASGDYGGYPYDDMDLFYWPY